MAKRTHSTIDKLSRPLRDAMTRMVVDNEWPADFPGETEGKPRYEDIVTYCKLKNAPVSPSAVGRWAKQLRNFERMKTAGLIARDTMKGLDGDAATETQKAAAEIMTAHIIELICSEDLSAKEVSMVSGAIRDCTQVALKADQYIRKQIEEKTKAAAESARKKLTNTGVDRKKVQEIIDDILGITK
jgi:hypothetical protein